MSFKIDIPKGFYFYGEHIGIKKRKKDLGVIFSKCKCSGTAVFTKNTFCGVSIPIGKNNIKNNELQSIIVTSGIANVATGEQGTKNSISIINSLAQELEIEEENILPSSTGIIGPQLPVEKILSNIPGIRKKLLTGKVEDFASAILTTDTKMKMKSIKIGDKTVLGIAKGSGMLEPNMATMLVYILTDAYIPKNEIYKILKSAVDKSFNMISIDTDTSTSDTVALLANGISGEVNLVEFSDSLELLCIDLAKQIVLDGEGATKLIEVEVKGADSFVQAKKIAKSVVNSPLVKTAVYGNDANWGRIAMAVGKTFEEIVDPEKIIIDYAGCIVYDKGLSIEENVEKASDYLKSNNSVKIGINMGGGNSSAKVWGCDLTEGYVHINGEYRT